MSSLRLSNAQPLLSATDPWIWTVEQVVSALTDPHGPLLLANTQLSLPDPTILAATLRNHDVTGLAVLTEVNSACMRDELGIKSLGQRAALGLLIKQLQDSSVEMQRQRQRSARLWSGSCTVLEEGPTGQETVRLNLDPLRSLEYLQGEEGAAVHARGANVDLVTPGKSMDDSDASASSKRYRYQGQTIVVDEQWEKRRRLEPAQTVIPWLASVIPGNSPDPEEVSSPTEFLRADKRAYSCPETSFVAPFDR